MPQYDDEDDDVDTGCSHCSCYDDGSDCCDCGESGSDNYDDDEDDFPVSSTLVCEDDGSEESKD